MARLIDADDFIAEHCADCKYFNVNGICTKEAPVCGSMMIVAELPTIDAVEVVRCKDCKHYHQYHAGKTTDLCEWGKCKLINMDVDMPENGYCCFRERKCNDA